MKGMAEMFGEDGFSEFLTRMRGGGEGETRRTQIISVTVHSDHVVLEATTRTPSPNSIWMGQGRLEGWKRP